MTNWKIETVSTAKPRFLWWRFALTVTILILLGVGFYASWYCEPAPSRREVAVFTLVQLVILVQTIQARWYRNDFPAEFGYVEAIVTFLKALVLLAIAGAVLWLTMFLTSDPIAALFAVIATLSLVIAVNEISKGGSS